MTTRWSGRAAASKDTILLYRRRQCQGAIKSSARPALDLHPLRTAVLGAGQPVAPSVVARHCRSRPSPLPETDAEADLGVDALVQPLAHSRSERTPYAPTKASPPDRAKTLSEVLWCGMSGNSGRFRAVSQGLLVSLRASQTRWPVSSLVATRSENVQVHGLFLGLSLGKGAKQEGGDSDPARVGRTEARFPT